MILGFQLEPLGGWGGVEAVSGTVPVKPKPGAWDPSQSNGAFSFYCFRHLDHVLSCSS